MEQPEPIYKIAVNLVFWESSYILPLETQEQVLLSWGR